MLGTHNAIQNTVALAATPLAALLMESAGFWAGFAAGLACALLSLPVVPVRGERRKEL
ncbi:hypothetical protein [Nonomuraea sp. SYSU D8015]|uniref:hypothetical protein n=1 Tax=Nonomuraea sp. SYSU D8015 TaxID=2593644 RepID=UPI0016611F68|nr:hypothetical protein [Nonomuraea sp. SYSU D8015]